MRDSNSRATRTAGARISSGRTTHATAAAVSAATHPASSTHVQRLVPPLASPTKCAASRRRPRGRHGRGQEQHRPADDPLTADLLPDRVEPVLDRQYAAEGVNWAIFNSIVRRWWCCHNHLALRRRCGPIFDTDHERDAGAPKTSPLAVRGPVRSSQIKPRMVSALVACRDCSARQDRG